MKKLYKWNEENVTDKKKYVPPHIERVLIDATISLSMESEPPDGPPRDDDDDSPPWGPGVF